MKLPKFLKAVFLTGIAAVGLWAPVSTQAADPNGVRISQVYGGGGNSGATYKNDFIELYNPSGSDVVMSTWSVQYGSSSGTGAWTVTTINGTIPAHGYFLVKEAAGTGGTTDLPTPDATGTIAMGAGAGKVALLKVNTALSGACPASTNILDTVGYGAANCSEPPPTPGLANETAAVRRGNGCTDTGNNAADFKVIEPTPRNSKVTFDCATLPPPTNAAIHEIQGSGARSPLADRDVITTGVITARKYNGIFIQEPDPGDGDPSTSDGVFVYFGTTPPTNWTVGSMVQVAATVSEYVPTGDLNSPPMTELNYPSVTILSTGNPLPAPIAITMADLATADGLERYEGMRVQVPGLNVVGPTEGTVNETAVTASSNGIFYGVLDGVNRPFREEGVSVFEPLPAGSTIPRFDENPERIRVDDDALLGTTKVDVTTGAKVAAMVGPLDFGDRTYTIDPETTITVPQLGIQQARAVRLANGDEFTVASFNMERFFSQQELSGITDANLAKRLSKASLAINNVLNLPDILGIEEMGNLGTLTKLRDKVNADAVTAGKPNPQYEAYLQEGNDIGGIDVGFLVKTTRVGVLDVQQVGKDTTYLTPSGTSETLNDRPPLVLTAVVGTSPMSMPVTVIVNHLRSLNGVEDADGRVRAKRAAQAQFLADLIQTRQAANPLENIVSVGDYNAFEVNDGYVDVMGIIRGEPAASDRVLLYQTSPVAPVLTDLVKTLDPAEQYSYSFGGNAQVLDHVLVNSPFMKSKTDFMYARNNADFAQALWGDSTRPERLSDHDMPVAYFTLVDTTAPSISCGAADGQWHATDVTIHCSAADGGSGLADGTDAALTLATAVDADTETANAATNSKSICDQQNNCTSAGPVTGNMIDKKKPELSATATSNGASYTSGWTNHDVVVTFNCTDGGSGVASVTSPTTVSSEGSGQVVSGSCTDNVGNESLASFSGIAIDKTTPEVGVTGPVNGNTYPLGSVPVAACTTTDALSGVKTAATAKVTGGTTNGVGLFTATCSGATDNAGNQAAPVAVSYTVAYNFSGFFTPLASRSTFKAGSTVPVKWQLLNTSGAQTTDVSSFSSLQLTPSGACAVAASDTVIDLETPGSTWVRYDGTQFIFNWQTKGVPAGCYNLTLKLDDTTSHTVAVELR